MSKKIFSLLLVLVMLVTCFTSCKLINKWFGKDPTPTPGPQPGPTGVTYKQAQYNTTTSVMPSNWNELTYADNNDTQIMSYIGSSFFSYDYKFENDQKFLADGSINRDGIVDGAFTTNYDAATKLEDVTATVDAKWGYTPTQKEEGGYAWKITLRDDLKWHDGTPITAEDFIYSMKAQLDPAFMNFRANTYYDNLKIKGSRAYFFQNQEGTYESVGSFGYTSNQAAVDAGETIYIDLGNILPLFGMDGKLFDENGSPAPQWIVYNDPTVFYDASGEPYMDAPSIWAAIGPGSVNASYFEPGGDFAGYVTMFKTNTDRDVSWDRVGMYAEGNAIVICLDKSYEFLKEDGSLSLWAAYYMSGLPLVKKDVYEKCKIEPAAGSTLWTSNYNSSFETSASWGPYMLAEFEAGSHYKLVKNPNWYGWNMETNKNQYNVTSIYCRKVAEQSTAWMGFLKGDYDDAALTDENIKDYLESKYISWSAGTGTFGMQLYSNLPVLKASGNNNGILAITEFRQAFNLALNRSDIVEKIWPGSAAPCFGLVNSEYYYDIENAANLASGGKYRNTKEAKEGILRAYGFTQGADGKWSTGDLTGLNLDEAYASLTGYNMTVAKQRLAAAIAELTSNAEHYGYDASKPITFVYGSSQDTAKQRERADYLQGVLDTLTAGTVLEGKIEVKFDASAGAEWANAFRTGATQIGFGYGFSGNAFDPFDIVGAFVNPDDDLNYHAYWDTSAVNLTLTLPAGDYQGAGKTVTMSLQNWYFCLNGLAAENQQEYTYNLDEGAAPVEVRLMILAALEEVTIKESRSVMLIKDSGGSFLGAKFSQFSQDYNTFLGFGGIRYMVVEYTDAEWTDFVNSNGGDLAEVYKKSE